MKVLPSVSGVAEFTSKNILICGAVGAMGIALARDLAGDGVTLVLADKRVPALERLYDELVEKGAECIILGLDFEGATPADYDSVAESMKEQLGHIDVVFHCASHFKGLSLLEQMEPLEWMRSMQVNVNGPFVFTQSLLSCLTASKEGRVVFMLDSSSTNAAFWGSYGVNKWALNGLIKIWGQELDQQGIKVVGVDPGAFRSAMQAEIYPGEDPKNMRPAEQVAAAMRVLVEDDLSLVGSECYKIEYDTV